jgi:hypothetical protein
LPPGTSTAARLDIEIGPRARAGIYVGYLLVSPVPEAALPIRLHVWTASEPHQ